MLTKVDIVLETMSSRSSSRVFSLSTVPSRSSTWPTKSHGPAAMNAVAIAPRPSSGQQDVAGNLLADEPAERKVGVEGGDDIVAIGPGMVAALVLVVAVSVAVMDDVKPVPAPALAIMGTGEQPIDECLVGVGIGVVDERVDFVGSRRQADQVEREAADQGAAIGLGAGLESLLFERGQDERVDRRACPVRSCDRGDLGAIERLEGPPSLALEPAILERQPGRPDRAPLDPARGSTATSCFESGLSFCGISGGSPAIMSSRTLSSGFPGTTAGPLSPPLNAAAAVFSDRFPLCVASP